MINEDYAWMDYESGVQDRRKNDYVLTSFEKVAKEYYQEHKSLIHEFMGNASQGRAIIKGTVIKGK